MNFKDRTKFVFAESMIALLKKKDLKCKKGYIFINPDKLYIMNEILLKLV